MSNNPINLIYATDSKMVMPMAVSMYSVLRRLRPGMDAHIYIVDGGVANSAKHHVERVVRAAAPERTVEINWVKSDPAWWGEEALDFSRSTLTEATMYRFGLAHFVPEDVSRAVYLDCDVFAKADVAELLEQIPEDGVACAVVDYSQPTWFHRYRDPELINRMGASVDTPYFNAGILGINVDEWRKHDVPARAVAFVRSYKDKIRFFSQDPMNAALRERWKALELTWNFPPTCRDKMGRKGLSIEELYGTTFEELQAGVKLVHFTGAKPWNQGFTNPLRPFFIEELRASRWFSAAGYAWWSACWYGGCVKRAIVNAWTWKIKPRCFRLLKWTPATATTSTSRV